MALKCTLLLQHAQVGGEAWRQQHDAIVSLTLQAHHNVATHSDEFVKEALVLHDRLRVLVFDLLTHEVCINLNNNVYLIFR